MDQIHLIEVMYGPQIDEEINIKCLYMLCSGVRSIKNRVTLRKTNLIAILSMIRNSNREKNISKVTNYVNFSGYKQFG